MVAFFISANFNGLALLAARPYLCMRAILL